MSLPNTAREIRLASRPTHYPVPENFELAEVPVPTPGDGQLLVRNLVMSIDPYMRGRMNDVESYVPPFRIGEALEGEAVGEVVASNAPGFAVGDVVRHLAGWREYAAVDASTAVKVDADAAPPGAYLGVLGMPALTACVGLLEVAGLREGDAVFVSGAAGAVGQVAGQVARLCGAKRVVGSTGSAAKVAYLVDELGFDAAFDYHDGPVAEQLAAAAPEGVDVYFDNVGGEHLDAALLSLNNHGRVALCGGISGYNTPDPVGVKNLLLAVTKEVTLRGFLVYEHPERHGEYLRRLGEWLASGRLRHRETVTEGLERAPEAFIGMLRGENVGKALVKL